MKSTKQFKPAALFQNAKTIVSILLLGMAVFVSQGAWALGGSGTKASPYTISSEADLREFADIVNGTNAKNLNANAFGVLTGDITLTRTWTPMGSSANPYTGTFDGQGHTISGLSGSQGLFAYTSSKTISGVAYDATIKSFTLKGSISSAADNTGSVVGAAYGDRDKAHQH